MSTPQRRVTGTYGRRPPKRAPAIQFRDIRRRGPVEAPPPAAVDYIRPMGGGWKMLGNGPDNTVAPGFGGCGNCVAVWWANTRRTISTVIGGHSSYPPWSEVLAVYKTQNPDFDPTGGSSTGPSSPADGGMDIQTLLEWLVANPGPDGSKLIGFAAVDYTSAAEVSAAIAAGGVLCVGINVLDINQTEFGNDQPWDYVASSPVDGGHCTMVGGYGAEPAGSDPDLAGNVKFVTWAEETSFTPAFWGHEVEELWFVVWEEQLGTVEFQAGVNEAAFAAEFTAITGKPFPVAVTPPTPVPPTPVPPAPVPPAPVPPAPVPPAPVPPPGPDAADQALATVAEQWMADTHPFSHRLREALGIWLAAKGFTTP